MVKTIFWLTVMWVVGGYGSVIIYAIIDMLKTYCKLYDAIEKEDAEKELDSIFDEVNLASYLSDFIMSNENPNAYGSFSSQERSVGLMIMRIFDWPHILKLWHEAMHPLLQNVITEHKKEP